MIAADLRPTDPVRWYFAYLIEREQAKQRDQAGGPRGESDIEVLDG
jgi:hypothetical protein